MRLPLLPGDTLDPAPDADWGWPGVVPIPWSELESRPQELPPKGSVLNVKSGPGCKEAIQVLQSMERTGQAVEIPTMMMDPVPARFRLWAPNAFLMSQLPDEGPFEALDLGCGCGREAIAMAASGGTVTAVDRLSDALARGAALERVYLSEPEIRWRVSDLRAHRFEPTFDWVVVLFAGGRASLEAGLRAVRPGGHLVFETFSAAFQQRTGHPRSPFSALDPDRDLVGLHTVQLELTERTVRVVIRGE